ncbi:hypothetical protein DBR47_00750 [Paucibacter sp. KBW04]|uniref:helix-turn-helix domain-containing protein n=1 Tax=Paucibacter sp. KBW04 TaxID=2153361 RepID=UPI000F567510|nr:helix-turn-helix transcriptional regulator [Paucibacter sp. KBW04]RQO63134.1 hypothetical protein DBR47_00750 [Paucibacter sp. KBW04]
MSPEATQPAWLKHLADHCRQYGQRHAANMLGYSATTINQCLKGSYMADTKQIEQRVRERLTDTWLHTLRLACERGTQAQAAQQIGVSETTVSQVLSGNYKANTLRIERRVRGELMGAECDCPVMGDVSLRVCQDVQERQPGKSGTGIGNPQHAQAWHACRGSGRFIKAGQCPHFNGAGAKSATALATQEGKQT